MIPSKIVTKKQLIKRRKFLLQASVILVAGIAGLTLLKDEFMIKGPVVPKSTRRLRKKKDPPLIIIGLMGFFVNRKKDRSVIYYFYDDPDLERTVCPSLKTIPPGKFDAFFRKLKKTQITEVLRLMTNRTNTLLNPVWVAEKLLSNIKGSKADPGLECRQYQDFIKAILDSNTIYGTASLVKLINLSVECHKIELQQTKFPAFSKLSKKDQEIYKGMLRGKRDTLYKQFVLPIERFNDLKKIN